MLVIVDVDALKPYAVYVEGQLTFMLGSICYGYAVLSHLFLLKGIDDKLIVSHRVGVGLEQQGFQAFYLGVGHLHLVIHQPPEIDMNAQLLKVQHLTMLAVLNGDAEEVDVLTEETDAKMIDLHLGLQLVLEQRDSLL